jgi:PHD/YefM family antitoxin component YafN of YafNO toxin-antitoxin module
MNASSQKRWKVSDAKEKFSEMVRQAAKAPQLIFNRERLVAVVLAPAAFEKLESWERAREKATLAEAFVELRRLCSEESYALEVLPRADRDNVFAEALEDVSR